MPTQPAYWLMKSEPDTFSICDLERKGVAGWDGVRNYQARNFMRAMHKGDLAFFYHSSTKIPSIVGLMEIVRDAYPDSSADVPGWDQVDVKFVKVYDNPLSLDRIKQTPKLRNMKLVKSSRLSVQPVTPAEWDVIQELLARP